MWVDIQDVMEFYRSPLGKMTRRTLRSSIRTLWPSAANENLLGIGYALPYVRPYRQEVEHLCLAMPKALGATTWPLDGANLVTLADEESLPFPDRIFDKIILIHAVEFSDHLDVMLKECWRVLAHGGRLLTCVPNRRGMWSRMDKTPFGYGQPYSHRQLSKVLVRNHFTPLQTRHALYLPPFNARAGLKMFQTIENFGKRWLSNMAGVMMVESGKQLMRPIGMHAAVNMSPPLVFAPA
jgi:SAM-dependent methyltransferase